MEPSRSNGTMDAGTRTTFGKPIDNHNFIIKTTLSLEVAHNLNSTVVAGTVRYEVGYVR